MKRRDFIKKGAAGATAIGITGCSALLPRKYELERKFAVHSFEVTHPKPSGGTMPVKELGTTGIKVSEFGFGAHMPGELVPFEKERQVMIREAYDHGVTVFDIYDHWGVEQFEPMSRHLAPIVKDVILSLNMKLRDGRTCEQEFERALRIFGRDYIDMYRLNADASYPDNITWAYWENLFKYKEQGKIRAVGMSIHFPHEVELVMKTYPIDYVIFPFNFYHNLLHDGKLAGDYKPLVERLKENGIGVVVMKPFGTDWFVTPLCEVAKQIDKTGEISLPQAMLRYVINSNVQPDVTLGGMFNLDHVYEDIQAFYHPEMSGEERKLLEKLTRVTKIVADNWYPDNYKFLDTWTTDTPDTAMEEHI